MFKCLVFGILLANSAFCDDTVLREQSSETENQPLHLLRSPYIYTNKVEIQDDLPKNKTSTECPNTAILLRILDILTKSLPPFGNTQLEPEKIKYVLEVIKKYLKNSTPSIEHVELYNKFRKLEDFFNIANKLASRSLQFPNSNDSPNEDSKAKVTVQIELPIQNSDSQNIYEYIMKFINSAYSQITKYCDSTGLCQHSIPKWEHPATQNSLVSDLYKLIIYLQHLPAPQKWLIKEHNSPNDAYYDSNLKNNNLIGKNDIMPLLQNYRPQELASDSNNVQNDQSPGQIYVTHPKEGQNQSFMKSPGNLAVNSIMQNNQIPKTLLEKLLSIQISGKNNFSYPNEQQNKVVVQPGSGVNAENSNVQDNQISKLLLEKLSSNQTPRQLVPENILNIGNEGYQVSDSYPNDQQNQGSVSSPSFNNNANNQVQNNQIITLMLEKLLSNQSPKQIAALNKPADSSYNIPENILNINNQEYQVPDLYLQGPTELNITYTISNGKVIPVQSNQYNESASTLLENLVKNNRYALNKLYASTQLHKTNPSNPSPTNMLNYTLYPHTVNYGKLPDLSNSQKPSKQYVNTFNLQGNLNPAQIPFNPFKNIQNIQYPSVGYLPNYHYMNTKQYIKNPNQQNTFNQYQNTHSNIIGVNQESKPGYISPNLPYVNTAYVNPYVLSSRLSDNNGQGNNGLNLPDLQRIAGAANFARLHSTSDNSNKLVEITYVLQRPQQVLYEPVYYIKYRIPYHKFKYDLQKLLLTKPHLQNNPNQLYQELLAQSNLTDISPDTQGVDSNKVIKLVSTNGTLIDAKLLQANESAIGEQLKIIQELNSKLDPKDVINLNIAAVDQLKNLRQSQQNNSATVNNNVGNYIENNATNTLAVEATGNTRTLNQFDRVYTSQLYKDQQLINNPSIYSGQQTIRYQLPVMKQMVGTVPLAYSQNPLLYKHNFVYGK